MIVALVFLFTSAGYADIIWGTDVSSSNLTGTRSTASGGGLTAGGDWTDGNFDISWNITKQSDNNTWSYTYTLTTSGDGTKDISHFDLEVTNHASKSDFNNFSTSNGDTKGVVEDPKTLGDNSMSLPNDFYGIKFDWGDSDSNDNNSVTYSFKTERSPVWSVFAAKGGQSDFWSNALNFEGFNDNSLKTTDFIARPNGTEVPIPGAAWLLGAGLLGLIGFRRKR